MIEFTRGYQGKKTQKRFFAAGTRTDEFDAETVEYLVSVQAAVVVEEAHDVDNDGIPDDAQVTPVEEPEQKQKRGRPKTEVA